MGDAPNSSRAACRRAEMEDSFFAAWSIRNAHVHRAGKVSIFLRDSWSLRNDWHHNGNTVAFPSSARRGMTSEKDRKGGSHAVSIKSTVADHIRRHLVVLDILDRSKPSVPGSGRSASR